MDHEKELGKLMEKADNGDGHAMMEAVLFLLQHGYTNSGNPAVMERYHYYLKELTNDGSTTALILLGDAFEHGNGIDKSIENAIICFEKAGEDGEPFGYECLGSMFFRGDGLPADYQKAFEYFEKAKETLFEGRDLSFCSLFALGEMYRDGLGVEQDHTKACQYYKEIVYCDSPVTEVDDHYLPACYRLGEAKLYGNGVEKDLEEARELITRAMEMFEDSDEEESYGIQKEELLKLYAEAGC